MEELKMVINSKELENRRPLLKETFLTRKPVEQVRRLPEEEPRPFVEPQLETVKEPSMASLFSDNDMLLPHERIGGDFSWIQTQSQEDLKMLKAHEVEDEESFLYGNGSVPTTQQFPSSFSYPNLATTDFDNIKNILKNVGSTNEGVKIKAQPQTAALPICDSATFALPALNNPNVRQALESLQSLIKATKEKRSQSEGSVSSQCSSDKNKANADEKQVRKTKMEILMKELDGLLKQDGLSFLTPVIGFYCHKCEEFIGDLNTAEKHAAVHRSSSSSKPQPNTHTADVNPPLSQTDRKDSSKNYPQREWKEEKPSENQNKNAGNLSLREKLKEERMLITVSCGETTIPKVKQENEQKLICSRSRSKSRSSHSSSSEEEKEKKAHKKKKKNKKKKRNKK